MTQNKHCSLIITINNQNKIKITILNYQNKEQIIKLNENQQDEYLPITISFDMNEIIINQQTQNSIDFFNDWINQPDEYKEYKINYQNKEYSVISEVFFALIMNEFKRIIEHDWIIDSVSIEIPTENEKIFDKTGKRSKKITL